MKENIFVNCPTCKAQIKWIDSNSERPFCSERCKNNDFIGWAHEYKSINGNSSYDDIFSEDKEKK